MNANVIRVHMTETPLSDRTKFKVFSLNTVARIDGKSDNCGDKWIRLTDVEALFDNYAYQIINSSNNAPSQ